MSRREYRARHILLEDIEDAEYVMDKILNGESFSLLASELSECPSASNGGDLGRFFSGQMVAEFERAVHNLKIDEVSPLIKSSLGYHIIQRLPLDGKAF